MIVFDQLGRKGRLGNILFEIASTIGIATKLNTDYGFNDWTGEGCFGLDLPKCNRVGHVYEEYPNMDFSNEVYNQGSNFTLDGYFQSERYFEDIKPQIRKLFTFRKEIVDRIAKTYQLALRLDPVSLHVRRTDYITQNWFVGDQWYLDRMNEVHGKLVLVFSDDIHHCMELFKDFKNILYIHEDEINSMCLMSMCQHHVISNSTFSWWGAWLSGSNDVTYPNRFDSINNGACTFPNKDFYPQRWKMK